MSAPQTTTPERIIRFTVDMPESLHQQLCEAATRLKRNGGIGELFLFAHTLNHQHLSP